MKKNIIGILAIIMGLGLSAFTNHKNNKALGTPYFWYQVSGTVTSGGTLNPDGEVDKTDAMHDLTLCNDLGSNNCLFGSTSDQVTNGTSIGTPASDQLIKSRP
jgi:hypothetical protein